MHCFTCHFAMFCMLVVAGCGTADSGKVAELETRIASLESALEKGGKFPALESRSLSIVDEQGVVRLFAGAANGASVLSLMDGVDHVRMTLQCSPTESSIMILGKDKTPRFEVVLKEEDGNVLKLGLRDQDGGNAIGAGVAQVNDLPRMPMFMIYDQEGKIRGGVRSLANSPAEFFLLDELGADAWVKTIEE